MNELYNCFGEELEGAIFIPKDPKFVLSDGKADWDNCIAHGDKEGFDTTAIVFANGLYKEEFVLEVGTRIIRYGLNTGYFTADFGTPYELLSLPWEKKFLPYHEYVVISPCAVERQVVRGYVAPGFGSQGGVIQYKHRISLRKSIENHIVEEDMSWLDSMKIQRRIEK